MTALKKYSIKNYTTYKGIQYEKLDISYQVFGPKLNSAPIVLVNHALTGNSDVISEDKGWWKELIGTHKLIDLEKYTVIVFNILGNGYDDVLIDSYKDFIARDIAQLFYLTLQSLNVEKLYAAIGGSLGGGIAWEIAALYPSYIENLIPIAADWKSTDWIIGHNAIQESILLNSKKPLQDARKMAMLFYRTPKSFTQKFNRTKVNGSDTYNVESWLNHHGKKIESRFELKAYLMMNHLLSTIDIARAQQNLEEVLSKIKSNVIQIAVDTDLFFVKEEAIKTKKILDRLNIKNEYYEVNSDYGHDAFLVEHQQIEGFLKEVF